MRGGNVISSTANIGFLVLVVLGAAFIGFRGDGEETVSAKPKVVATRALPANHQLQLADLSVEGAGVEGDDEAASSEGAARAMAELAGRYLTAPVAKGKAIGKVAASPRLTLDGGAIVVGFAVSRGDAMAGTIDAGIETLACSGRKQASVRSFIVEAVQCPAEGGDCVGFIRLPPAQRQEPALFDPGLAPRLSHVACDASVPDKPEKPSK